MLAISSLLFVPGSRPDRFAKAAASGADMVVIDLEDAVADADKGMARDAVIAALASEGGRQFAVRINAVHTAAGMADILALHAQEEQPAALFLPMVESAAEVSVVRRAYGDAVPAIVPLVETAKGLAVAADIAAERGVAAMMFGGGDMAGELGVPMSWDALAHARGAFVLACAAAHVPAIDVPWLALDDHDGLLAETRRVRAMGYGAKAAIHPAQVDIINRVMRPSQDEVQQAQAALAAYEAGGRRAIRYQGRMLEAPVVKAFEAVIAKAGRGNNA